MKVTKQSFRHPFPCSEYQGFEKCEDFLESFENVKGACVEEVSFYCAASSWCFQIIEGSIQPFLLSFTEKYVNAESAPISPPSFRLLVIRAKGLWGYVADTNRIVENKGYNSEESTVVLL